MLPIIAWGSAAVAAFFLSGCKKEVPPPPPKPKEAAPDASPPPLPPRDAGQDARQDAGRKFAEIEETLKGHPRALKAYQTLRENGVELEDLDQGCHEMEGIQGARNFKIEACEVYEYALDNFSEFPEAAKEVISGDIPWRIESKIEIDQNSPDPFQMFKTSDEFSKTIEDDLANLKNVDVLRDLDPGSAQYKLFVATALYYRVHFPKKFRLNGYQKDLWSHRSTILRYFGLHSFQETLLSEGGFGVSDFNSRSGIAEVQSAQGAWEKQMGNDIAKANLIFAAFEKAGLNPFFATSSLRFADPKKEVKRSMGDNIRIYKTDYVTVGVPLGKGYQLFHSETAQLLPDEIPHQRFPSLRHYLGNYLGEMGAYYLYQGKNPEKAAEFFRHGIQVWPGHAKNYNGLGLSLQRQEKYAEAEKAFREGLVMDSDYPFLYTNLAEHLKTHNKAPVEDTLPLYHRVVLGKYLSILEEETRNKIKAAAEEVLKSEPENNMAREILEKF